MSQQSLEELSSIYSEASELGLTSLGVTQPPSQDEEEDDIIQQSAISAMAAEGLPAEGGLAVAEGSHVVELEQREPEEYYSDQVRGIATCTELNS